MMKDRCLIQDINFNQVLWLFLHFVCGGGQKQGWGEKERGRVERKGEMERGCQEASTSQTVGAGLVLPGRLSNRGPETGSAAAPLTAASMAVLTHFGGWESQKAAAALSPREVLSGLQGLSAAPLWRVAACPPLTQGIRSP